MRPLYMKHGIQVLVLVILDTMGQGSIRFSKEATQLAEE